MNFIPFIFNLYSKAKENNILSGIIIFDIFAFLAYIINPFSLIYPGDIDMLFGGIISLIFSFKNRKVDQSSLKLGLTIGFYGSLISAITITVYEWIYVFTHHEIDSPIFLMQRIIFLILAIAIGVILGIIFGWIYAEKTQSTNEESKNLDEFLNELD